MALVHVICTYSVENDNLTDEKLRSLQLFFVFKLGTLKNRINYPSILSSDTSRFLNCIPHGEIPPKKVMFVPFFLHKNVWRRARMRMTFPVYDVKCNKSSLPTDNFETRHLLSRLNKYNLHLKNKISSIVRLHKNDKSQFTCLIIFKQNEKGKVDNRFVIQFFGSIYNAIHSNIQNL
ncbi:hypothetical protein AGLY_009243 [Aphis glycines]|uniref:Uncharacterized protein n=1 Tax=Aphis glycines TaxID=307491 RepID=A0A6G0TIJ3_APHGL|nr:hypothetical protein AGLY_009243 [Aphis glycines]